MKPLHLKIHLFNPLTDEQFPVSDGIEVDVVRIERWNPTVGFDALRMNPDHTSKVFSVDKPDYKAGRDHFIRVGFAKPNFSKKAGKLLTADEVNKRHYPILLPSRLPYWDTGLRSEHKKNEHFDRNGPVRDTSAADPMIVRIPLREMFIVGHRGHPYHYPENTLAAFKKALDLGANALEFDLCLTKDERIAVFHDVKPVKLPPNLDRTLFEPLPYELISPTFHRDNNATYATCQEWKRGKFVPLPPVRLQRGDEYDLINMTFKDVQRCYHYAPVGNTEHTIPVFEEFLDFASEEAGRIRLLFFDVKNPADAENKELFRRYGTLMGEALKRYPKLPARLVVCNPDKKILGLLKESIFLTGETRCEFAFDASGGLGALLSIEDSKLRNIPAPFRWIVDLFTTSKENSLKIAQEMRNSVVSVGTLARPGGADEITEAVLDRDYNIESSITTVIHWTLNDPAQMLKSINYGVNAILTDKPEEMKELLRRLRAKVG